MNRTLLAIALLGASAIVTAGAQAQSRTPYPVSSPQGIGASWTPSAEQSYAKSAIQSAGFNSITGLTRSSDGAWHAHAMKNNAKVDVSLDRAGRVTAN